MIKERTNTGGSKEFVYTDEDRRRIASEDTESTREFKKALREHRNKPKPKINLTPPKDWQFYLKWIGIALIVVSIYVWIKYY